MLGDVVRRLKALGIPGLTLQTDIPAWQTTFISVLRDTFPHIQFIANTHSPMVLPGLKTGEIVPLKLDERDRVVKISSRESPAFKTGTRLYDQFFGIDWLEPRALADALVRYTVLARDPHRTAEQEAEMRTYLERFRSQKVDPGLKPLPRQVTSGKGRVSSRRTKGNGL